MSQNLITVLQNGEIDLDEQQLEKTLSEMCLSKTNITEFGVPSNKVTYVRDVKNVFTDKEKKIIQMQKYSSYADHKIQ
jgi:hypothetical protein